MVEKRDDEALVKALVDPGEGIKYRGAKNKPLIQILKNGCWFIQKSSKAHGLGKSKLESLIQAIKKK